MKFEKFTLLRMHVDNVHGNGHGYLAVPPPCAYTYTVWLARLLFSNDSKPPTLKSFSYQKATVELLERDFVNCRPIHYKTQPTTRFKWLAVKEFYSRRGNIHTWKQSLWLAQAHPTSTVDPNIALWS